MSNFQRVLIIIFLSITVIFISGILLPKYLSSRILDLRKELNSQNSNSKYSLQSNVVPVTEKQIQIEERNSNSSVEVTEFQTALSNPIQPPAKRKKRSKRHVVSGDEHFTWNFNFNLTGQRNHVFQQSPEMASDTSHKGKHLNIAIFTEGEAKRKTAFSDIQHTLQAVEYFFKYLFSAENLTREVETENEHSEIEFEAGANGDESMKGREGKFFNFGSLNIFGSRRSTEKSVSSSTVSTVPAIDSVSERETTVSVGMDILTENLQEMTNLSNFQAQSLVSEKLSLINNTSGSNLPGKTEDGECIDCNAVDLEPSVIVDQIKNDPSETESGFIEFTDDFLEMFCMRLVNKVGVSQHLSDSEDNIEPKHIDENHLQSSEKQISVFLPISGKLNSEISIEDTITNNNTSDNEARQKKFLSLSTLLEFGSGRAAEDKDDSNGLTSEGFADVDLANLPTLLDCESYFRRKSIKMFPKPNLMDIISDPKIQFTDFANATISSKLVEQHVQFLTNLLKTNLHNSVETFGKNSDGVVTKSASEEATFGNDGSTLSEVSNEIPVSTEHTDLSESAKILITSTDASESRQITEVQRDGRFIGMFGFGSGNSDSRSFGNDDFDTDRNEGLGSGDMTIGLSSDKNELLKETSRFLESSISSNGRNEQFGSGDSRSVETSFRTEVNEDSRSVETSFRTEVNEFGNDDSRSVETSFGTEVNEFVSGDSRSLETSFETEVNEFGSGDSRMLGYETFLIERNEFGSGNSRSFQTVAFGTSRNELGSGDTRSLGAADFGTEANNVEREVSGSPQDETSIIKREFGSGDFFNETSNLNEDLRFFPIGFLGFAGSGDGRDLPDSHKDFQNETKCENNCSVIVTDQLKNCKNHECNYGNSNESDLFEDRDLVKDACHGNCLGAISTEINKTIESVTISFKDYRQDCLDCNIENLNDVNRSTIERNRSNSLNEFEPIYYSEESVILNEGRKDENIKLSKNVTSETTSDNLTDEIDTKTQNSIENLHEKSTDKNAKRFLGPIFLTGSGDGGLFGDSGGPINLLEEEEVDDKDDRIDTENNNSKERNAIERPLEQTTEKNTQRFLETMFLSGSGDGRLLEGSGQINLIEEEKSTVKNFFLRKARLDDSLNISLALHEKSLDESKQDGNEPVEKFTSPVTTLRRRGRIDDTTHELCDDCDYDYEDFIENYRKKQNSSKFEKRINSQPVAETPLTNKKTTVTVPTDVIQSNPVFPASTKSSIKVHPCTAARECNVTLNERCVTVNSSRICSCSKGFVRNKETSKCIVKKIVETSIKLPAERFEEDLNNPFSRSFQKKRKSSVELMILLLQHDPELLRLLSEINDVKFRAGSLVITLNLVFAVENKSEAQLVKHVEDELQLSLRDETLIRSVDLNIREAYLVSVNGEIDYCKSSELNYCSEHAYCVSNPALHTSYSCHCKEHYRDVSFDPRLIGEVCLAKCPKEYCGPYGHCELLANDEKMCLCSGLYFGRRCEVPGLYVLIILGCVGFISLTMLLLVIFKKRCSRFSYRDSQTQGPDVNGTSSRMNGRVSDAIALEENIGTTKFMNISTPVPHPAIKITRPTITESGSSYDFDSTFDSTPHKTEENSTV